MPFPLDFLTYLKKNTQLEIKAGRNRKSFLPIWMVEVEGRVFARSWNKSRTSWFTEFLNSGVGQIRYGDKVVNIEGHKLDPADAVQKKINEAYLEKYIHHTVEFLMRP